MVDPNEHEVTAMRRAGERAGVYIDALGRTDMAHWSSEEWDGFIEAVCGAYVDALVNQQIAINDALGKVQGMLP
jgi:hypothetical protein